MTTTEGSIPLSDAEQPDTEPNQKSDPSDWCQPVKFLYLMGLIDRGVQRAIQRHLVSFDLSLPEFSALSVLTGNPGLSNAELARRALVTPQSMNEVIARLERRNFITRNNHPDHGRILMAVVTPEGQALFDRAMVEVSGLEQELLADIPEADIPGVRVHLLTILDRLRSLQDD